MLNKDYTFMQVHNFLVNNGFKKHLKLKCFIEKLLNIFIRIQI